MALDIKKSEKNHRTEKKPTQKNKTTAKMAQSNNNKTLNIFLVFVCSVCADGHSYGFSVWSPSAIYGVAEGATACVLCA